MPDGLPPIYDLRFTIYEVKIWARQSEQDLAPLLERRTPVRPEGGPCPIRADRVIGAPFSPCLCGGGVKLRHVNRQSKIINRKCLRPVTAIIAASLGR
jgi:hypothetical protein